jgi:hypothetical protein
MKHSLDAMRRLIPTHIILFIALEIPLIDGILFFYSLLYFLFGFIIWFSPKLYFNISSSYETGLCYVWVCNPVCQFKGRKRGVFKEKGLRCICGSKKGEVTGTVGNCTLKSLVVLFLAKYYPRNRMEANETGRNCEKSGVRRMRRY